MVGGGLALALDQDREVLGILAVPSRESTENLETVTLRRNSNLQRLAVLGRSLVGVTAGVVALGGKTLTSRRLKEELLAILALQLVGERVELEGTGNGHGNNKVGGGDEGVGGRVGVITASEVTVVGGDDGVRLALLDVLTVPLSNARTAGVGKDDTTELFEGLQLAITLNGSTDLLRARGDSEHGLGLNTVVKGVPSDRGGTGHVLIRGVGARADQTDLELLGPLVGINSLLELRDRGGKIGSERTVDVRLELGQVDLDQLIVFSTLVLTELLGIFTGEVTDALTLGGLQVIVHAVVEGEHGGGSTNLSTHVTDGAHTSTGERVDTRSVVLNDSTSTTLDSQKASDLEDNILRSSPTRHLTSEPDTDDLRGLQLPRKTSHDIDSVSTTNTNGRHGKTTSVGGVRVSTDHQTTGESIVLQDDLVNDTGTGLPETNVVLASSRGKEVIDLLVDLVGAGKILVTTNLSLDQVIAVDSGGGSDRGHASGHELQNSHLSGGVLASDTVGAHPKVGLATLDVLAMRIIKVRVQNLLSVGKRAAQALANNAQVLRHLPIKMADMLAMPQWTNTFTSITHDAKY